jgi:poly-gamma-glutamate synthesis protein (capsule biosynthesis protein)
MDSLLCGSDRSRTFFNGLDLLRFLFLQLKQDAALDSKTAGEREKYMATVVIGADICPIETNRPFFKSGDAKTLFNDLLPEFESADLTIANLECPLIRKPSPILKTGPVFGEDGDCINGIRAAGIDILNLANNHILDHGPAGLENTLRVCADAGIETVGAGENLGQARKMLVRKLGSLRVGILAVAEHEFSIATRDSWGANPLDMIDFVRNVNSRRGEFDYLIVLLHGGDEFLVPSPRIKDTCHFMIEMGANAVIVQHPHCLGGIEQYRGGHIVYGQGALVMDEALYRSRDTFHEGFLVKLHLPDTGGSEMNIVPFFQSHPAPGARRMSGERECRFLSEIEKRSLAVRDDTYVERQWLRFCEERKQDYLSTVLGHGRILRRLSLGGRLIDLFHGKKTLLGVRNAVLCETHREALATIFDDRHFKAH